MGGPGRPPNQNDLIRMVNGSPIFLGAIISTGAATNNLTTATPFNSSIVGVASQSVGPVNMMNTLAGKVLLLQTSAAGLILPSENSNMSIGGVVGQNIIALQTVMPPAVGTTPGVALAEGERVILTMMSTEGWMQWLPMSGSGNLLVWELR